MNSKKYFVRKNLDNFVTVFGNVPTSRISVLVDKRLVEEDSSGRSYISFPVKGVFYYNSDFVLSQNENYITYNLFFKKKGEVKIKILNQSIMNGWKGLFPLNNNSDYTLHQNKQIRMAQVAMEEILNDDW